METFYIPTESDFRRWIKEALKECFEEIRSMESGKNDSNEPLLDRKQTAEKLNISLVTLNDWVKHGLPAHKQRGKVYFLYSEVLEFIKRNKPGKFIELM